MPYNLCNLQLIFISKKSYDSHNAKLDELLICRMWGLNRGINITKVFATQIKLESTLGIELDAFEKAMVYASLWQVDESSTI